jgi:hypothetical protein
MEAADSECALPKAHVYCDKLQLVAGAPLSSFLFLFFSGYVSHESCSIIIYGRNCKIHLLTDTVLMALQRLLA